MRTFIVTIFMATLAVFFVSSNATAVTVTNKDKCVVTPCVGTDCQYYAKNSVSDQCTSITYTVVRHASDTSEDSGKEYGVYADCSECPSGYYVSDSKSSLAHNVCGKIEYYNTCAKVAACPPGHPTAVAASYVSNCADASQVKFGKTTFYTCNTCNSGYTRTAVTVSDTRCTNTTTKYTCVKSTTPPPPVQCTSQNCADDANWTCSPILGTGVCAKYFRQCVNNKCVASQYWQCQDGYYGVPLTPESSSHDCTKCPESSDGATVHSLDENRGEKQHTSTTITNCYVSDGSDTTGIFEYTSSCYYPKQD